MQKSDQCRPWLRLAGARVRLGSTTVLTGLDCALYPGEHVVVTGANAAGKSTFLRLCAGLVWPTDPACREYILQGRRTTSPLPVRHHGAWVAPGQQLAYQGRQARVTVWEVVATGLTNTPFVYVPLSEADAMQVWTTLERFGLQELAERSFAGLSQGQQWQVLLARAMSGGPRFLFLDECTSGLDGPSRDLFWQALHTAVQLGAHALLATPQPWACPEWIGRTITLDQGRIIAGPMRQTAEQGAAAKPGASAGATTGEPTNSRVLVRLSGARVRHEGRDLLGPVSLAIRAGTVWAVRGPNGAGKTTLLRLVSGDAPPYAGQGREYPCLPAQSDRARRETRIRAVFPDQRIELFVRNLPAGAIAGHNAGETRQLWCRFGLQGLEERPFAHLSSGQQQRVLLTRALAGAPSLLVLDEPFTALDAWGRAVCREVVQEHIARNVAVVYSAHAEADCFAGTDHVLWVSGGRVRDSGLQSR
ncbi:ATP-binding cassette domain-containing protein [Desulfohalobium retbaense]|uniref:ABC transporter related protein n=1 Tax=Desulfohalobium retbaense (strain ATCC 49708 / DSM 5692 / JCM 16813 / HR100) TaxID=485915 RepID=C8X4I8_DESRD|nr:ATP-binding cassette domain-containing protein [Desulfohalobium retbaense]ACV69211.1 ABC transporter related protein [Desulfohalobium retbaense DSM 5692]